MCSCIPRLLLHLSGFMFLIIWILRFFSHSSYLCCYCSHEFRHLSFSLSPHFIIIIFFTNNIPFYVSAIGAEHFFFILLGFLLFTRLINDWIRWQTTPRIRMNLCAWSPECERGKKIFFLFVFCCCLVDSVFWPEPRIVSHSLNKGEISILFFSVSCRSFRHDYHVHRH